MNAPILKRASVLILLCGVLAVGAGYLWWRGPGGSFLPDCVFHGVTGLHCPGCGMTRATYALMHGELAQAMRLNAVGVVVLPVALVMCFLYALEWVAGRKFLPALPVRWRKRLSWSIAVLMVGFFVLRNLPWWPFSLLAPH